MTFNHQSVLEPILFQMFFSVRIHTCWMGDRYLSGNIASRQMSIGPDCIPLWGGRHVHMINIPLSSTSQQIVDELTPEVESKSQVGFKSRSSIHYHFSEISGDFLSVFSDFFLYADTNSC